jgi:hypothetical protein
MKNYTSPKAIDKKSRDKRATNLLKETRILNIARLANMLVDLFGLEEGFKKVGNRAGEEVQLYITSLDGHLTFPLVNKKKNFECRAEKANNPVATVIINVKREYVLKLVSNIIKSKANVFGLFKLIPKFIMGKIKIKGSLMAALTLVQCLMIGKNKIYEK